MTVHCIEVMAATDVNAENVKNKIADLKSDYGEKLPKQQSPFTQGQTLDGSVTFYNGSFGVTLSQDSKTTEKNDLTKQIRKEMDKSASWWQVRWHECTHDDDNPQPCGWEYQNDSGNVPTEVSW